MLLVIFSIFYNVLYVFVMLRIIFLKNSPSYGAVGAENNQTLLGRYFIRSGRPGVPNTMSGTFQTLQVVSTNSTLSKMHACQVL